MELVRRMMPALYYCAREGADLRIDATTRAVLASLATDLLMLTDAALDAMTPDDRDEAVVRDLERARQRLRTARELGGSNAG
jgi:hypothetical protein